MKLNLLAGVALAAMAVATAAAAEQPTGWYGAIDAGYNSMDGWKARSTGLMPDGGPFVYDVSTKEDWAGFARLGYRYSPNWRVEFEGGYRPGDVDSAVGFPRTYPGIANTIPTALCTPGLIRTASTPCGGPKGSLSQSSLFVNLIYDILPESSFHPFVGVGVGLDHVRAKMIGQYSTNPTVPVGRIDHLTIRGSDTVAAYQFLAGMAWAVSDRMSVDLTYRYTGAEKASFDTISNNGVTPSPWNSAVGATWVFVWSCI
jgi:OOP family OmpA-OmpF porin